MTTESLEDYLAVQYHQDMDDIRELEETLERTANVFIYTCGEEGRWPYQYSSKDGAGAKSGSEPSHGTQAMIAAALARMSGVSALASGHAARLKLQCQDDLEVTQHLGTACLLDAIEGPLISGSFGTNDPVTLSHATSLLSGAKDRSADSQWKALKSTLKPTIEELRSLIGKDPLVDDLLAHLPRFKAMLKGGSATVGKNPDYLNNAFVPLRIVRAVYDLKAAGENLLEEVVEAGRGKSKKSVAAAPAETRSIRFEKNYRRYFESALHEQLSFSEIPDSRFDPAELIFCLEGLMLVAPYAVDERLFERVMSVLEARQVENAHWRPNRPIYATPQGMTMLPVSVEGAVSLMRSIALMDRLKDYQPTSTRATNMLRRFWKWLRARIVQFKAAPVEIAAHQAEVRKAAKITAEAKPKRHKYHELTGWHSEHVNDPGLIHLWDTSQVVEFMLAYRELLQRSIAGRTLLLSRLKIDLPARERSTEWETEWPGEAEKYEPRPGAGAKVYDKLTRHFVLPWGMGDPKNFSILLYGPPGTGKSSFAENLAKALGMRMITVTVSDFLGRGGENVEARVKAIFQTLEAQFDSVILFDEIDSFLLDRDSKRYRKQDSLFQFLTPGMLTKINDLRKKERSIFIIATNYQNRIDPAIKRKGRIDKKYLLPLPDEEKRRDIIKALRGKKAVKPENYKDIGELSTFFGYTDLKILVQDAGNEDAGDDDILKRLRSEEYQPATTLKSYLARFEEENYPFDELFDLVDLHEERKGALDRATLLKELPVPWPTPWSAAHEAFAAELCKRFEARAKKAATTIGARTAASEGSGDSE